MGVVCNLNDIEDFSKGCTTILYPETRNKDDSWSLKDDEDISDVRLFNIFKHPEMKNILKCSMMNKDTSKGCQTGEDLME